MVTTKAAKVNNLYILKYVSKPDTEPETKFQNNAFLVKLIETGTYGGKTSPILLRLIRIKPNFSKISAKHPDWQYQWRDLFHLEHKEVREEFKQLMKNPSLAFNAIFA